MSVSPTSSPPPSIKSASALFKSSKRKSLKTQESSNVKTDSENEVEDELVIRPSVPLTRIKKKLLAFSISKSSSTPVQHVFRDKKEKKSAKREKSTKDLSSSSIHAATVAAIEHEKRKYSLTSENRSEKSDTGDLLSKKDPYAPKDNHKKDSYYNRGRQSREGDSETRRKGREKAEKDTHKSDLHSTEKTQGHRLKEDPQSKNNSREDESATRKSRKRDSVERDSEGKSQGRKGVSDDSYSTEEGQKSSSIKTDSKRTSRGNESLEEDLLSSSREEPSKKSSSHKSDKRDSQVRDKGVKPSKDDLKRNSLGNESTEGNFNSSSGRIESLEEISHSKENSREESLQTKNKSRGQVNIEDQSPSRKKSKKQDSSEERSQSKKKTKQLESPGNDHSKLKSKRQESPEDRSKRKSKGQESSDEDLPSKRASERKGNPEDRSQSKQKWQEQEGSDENLPSKQKSVRKDRSQSKQKGKGKESSDEDLPSKRKGDRKDSSGDRSQPKRKRKGQESSDRKNKRGDDDDDDVQPKSVERELQGKRDSKKQNSPDGNSQPKQKSTGQESPETDVQNKRKKRQDGNLQLKSENPEENIREFSSGRNRETTNESDIPKRRAPSPVEDTSGQPAVQYCTDSWKEIKQAGIAVDDLKTLKSNSRRKSSAHTPLIDLKSKDEKPAAFFVKALKGPKAVPLLSLQYTITPPVVPWSTNPTNKSDVYHLPREFYIQHADKEQLQIFQAIADSKETSVQIAEPLPRPRGWYPKTNFLVEERDLSLPLLPGLTQTELTKQDDSDSAKDEPVKTEKEKSKKKAHDKRSKKEDKKGHKKSLKEKKDKLKGEKPKKHSKPKKSRKVETTMLNKSSAWKYDKNVKVKSKWDSDYRASSEELEEGQISESGSWLGSPDIQNLTPASIQLTKSPPIITAGPPQQLASEYEQFIKLVDDQDKPQSSTEKTRLPAENDWDCESPEDETSSKKKRNKHEEVVESLGILHPKKPKKNKKSKKISKKAKKKKKKASSDSSSDSESSSSSDSEVEKKKKRKKKLKKKEKKLKKKKRSKKAKVESSEESDSDSSSDDEKDENAKSLKKRRKEESTKQLLIELQLKKAEIAKKLSMIQSASPPNSKIPTVEEVTKKSKLAGLVIPKKSITIKRKKTRKSSNFSSSESEESGTKDTVPSEEPSPLSTNAEPPAPPTEELHPPVSPCTTTPETCDKEDVAMESSSASEPQEPQENLLKRRAEEPITIPATKPRLCEEPLEKKILGPVRTTRGFLSPPTKIVLVPESTVDLSEKYSPSASACSSPLVDELLNKPNEPVDDVEVEPSAVDAKEIYDPLAEESDDMSVEEIFSSSLPSSQLDDIPLPGAMSPPPPSSLPLNDILLPGEITDLTIPLPCQPQPAGKHAPTVAPIKVNRWDKPSKDIPIPAPLSPKIVIVPQSSPQIEKKPAQGSVLTMKTNQKLQMKVAAVFQEDSDDEVSSKKLQLPDTAKRHFTAQPSQPELVISNDVTDMPVKKERDKEESDGKKEVPRDTRDSKDREIADRDKKESKERRSDERDKKSDRDRDDSRRDDRAKDKDRSTRRPRSPPRKDRRSPERRDRRDRRRTPEQRARSPRRRRRSPSPIGRRSSPARRPRSRTRSPVRRPRSLTPVKNSSQSRKPPSPRRRRRNDSPKRRRSRSRSGSPRGRRDRRRSRTRSPSRKALPAAHSGSLELPMPAAVQHPVTIASHSHAIPPPLPPMPYIEAPKRLPPRLTLDQRIELELGVKLHDTPPPMMPIQQQPMPQPQYYYPPQQQAFATMPAHMHVPMPSYSAPAHGVLQVGNNMEVVPTVETRPPPPPPQQQIVQIGNMLQVVPTRATAVVAPTPQAAEPARVAPTVPPLKEVLQHPLIRAIMKEREKRVKEREGRHKEREARRRARQVKRANKMMSVSEKLKSSTSLIADLIELKVEHNEGLVLGQDLEEEELLLEALEPPSPPASLHVVMDDLRPAGKSILVKPATGQQHSGSTKSVKFADGVIPGMGSESEGENRLTSPKIKKESKKIKKKVKKKVKVRLVRQVETVEEDSDDDLPPPSPPPGDPPPVLYVTFPFGGQGQYPISHPSASAVPQIATAVP